MSTVPAHVYYSTGERVKGNFTKEKPAPPPSMEDLARECAVALGVEDDTNRFEGLLVGSLADIEAGRSMVAGRLRWLSADETRLFESYFASRYLPRLARACCSTGPSRAQRRHLGHYDDLLRLMAGGALFGAFARGPLAPECFDRLVERLAVECPKPDELVSGDSESSTTAFQCREAFGHLVGEIFWLLMQTTQSFPSQYPSTVRTLAEHARVLSSLSTQRKLKKCAFPNIEATGMAIFQLREIVDVLERKKTIDPRRDGNSRVPWAGCEITTIADESKHWKEATTDTCKQLGEEEETMKCAQCGIVRYCGREHQVAHWKLHKKVCRKPEW